MGLKTLNNVDALFGGVYALEKCFKLVITRLMSTLVFLLSSYRIGSSMGTSFSVWHYTEIGHMEIEVTNILWYYTIRTASIRYDVQSFPKQK